MVKKYLKEEEKLVERPLQPNFSFPKSQKIRKSFEYRHLSISKIRLQGSYILIDYRFNDKKSHPRLGITTPAKVAKAHLRNKFKRIAREVFRLNRHKLIKSLEINISTKTIDKNLKYADIEKDFLNLISSIKKKINF